MTSFIARKLLLAVAATCLTAIPSFAQNAGGPYIEHVDLKINEPVLVADTTLTPGNYEMLLLAHSDFRVVQIYNLDTHKPVATIDANHTHMIPNRTAGQQLEYWETPAGSPAALRAWFWPGDHNGVEFPYPAKFEAALAQAKVEALNASRRKTATPQTNGAAGQSAGESATGR